MILDGQVGIVTGSGQGIGRAIAVRLAQEGADIGIVEVNAETATETARQIEALGRRAVVSVADVSEPDQVSDAVAAVVGAFGRLDILVNNAGIEKMQPFLEITSSDWERQVDVNLSGTFYCTQAAGREMVKRGYGRIVNLSSVAGLMGPLDLVPYSTVKAGIVGFTRAAAVDLADYGITVNAIAPGPIQTDLLARVWTADALRERAQHAPIARLGTVEEIAHAALFFASPDSGFISGTTLAIDGGAVAAGSYMVEKYRRRKAAAT